jgi:hypothetical protein
MPTVNPLSLLRAGRAMVDPSSHLPLSDSFLPRLAVRFLSRGLGRTIASGRRPLFGSRLPDVVIAVVLRRQKQSALEPNFMIHSHQSQDHIWTPLSRDGSPMQRWVAAGSQSVLSCPIQAARDTIQYDRLLAQAEMHRLLCPSHLPSLQAARTDSPKTLKLQPCAPPRTRPRRCPPPSSSSGAVSPSQPAVRGACQPPQPPRASGASLHRSPSTSTAFCSANCPYIITTNTEECV